MLLLNILRASKKQPTYFTALTTVRGDATLAVGTGSVAVPFGGGGDEKYGINPNAALTIKPSFDMAVLDTHDFYRGYMQPVSPETLAFYLEQGWPAQMVLALFVREVRLTDGRTISNAPGAAQYDSFRQVLNGWTMGNRVTMQAVEKRECLGPDILQANLPPPETLLKLKEGGYTLHSGACTDVSKSGVYHLAKTSKELRLTTAPAPQENESADDARKRESNEQSYVVSSQTERRRADVPLDATKIQGEIILRSPEAILYYVGELVRRRKLDNDFEPVIQVRSSKPCSATDADKEEVLFRVDSPLQGNVTYAVTATFEGEEYGLRSGWWKCAPGMEKEDRSTHVLRLLSQLIGLQKSSQSFPVPQTLRVTN